MNTPSVQAQLFATAWRIGREQLRQQKKTLSLLYDEAQKADASRPKPPVVRLDQLTESDQQALKKHVEESGVACGARDAYATAVVMVIDNIFRMLWGFYKTIPGVTQQLTIKVNKYQRSILWAMIPHTA